MNKDVQFLAEAYTKVINENIEAQVIAALDAGQDAQVVFTKFAAKYGLHDALTVLEDLIDQNDNPNREMELKQVYNELMKGYKAPGFGPGSRRSPYSAAHFDPVRAVKENAAPSNDINVHPGDWGDEHQEVKGLIDQLISYGLDRNVLKAILEYAESVGYTGEGVDNLIKLIQYFNEKGVQDS